MHKCMASKQLLCLPHRPSCVCPGHRGFDPGEGLPVQPADPGGVQEPEHEQPRAAARLRRRLLAQRQWDGPQLVSAEQGGAAAPLGGAGRHQSQAAQIQTGAVRICVSVKCVFLSQSSQVQNLHCGLVDSRLLKHRDHIF